MIINKILEIMLYAYKISTRTKADVFVRYSPHVQGIDVDIYLNGWENSPSKHYEEQFSVMGLGDYSDAADLDEFLNRLKELWEESK